MIAFDNTIQCGVTTGLTLTKSFTCSGSNRLLVVGVFNLIASGVDQLIGVTYNGVPLVLIEKYKWTSNEWLYLYALVNPNSGAHNIVVSQSAGSSALIADACCYTGVRQSAQPDNFSHNKVDATSLNGTVVTVADNCWIVGYFRNGIRNMSPAVGTVPRAGVNDTLRFYDSGSAFSPAGSHAIGVTAISSPMACIVASIAPFIAGPTSSPNRTSRKNFNGYLAFVQQFFKHKMAGTTPWASPNGDLMP